MKLFFLFLSIFGVQGLGPDEKLIGLGVFARHGHRYPYNDFIPQNLQTNLSSIGLRQHYLLGKYLRKTYSSFFEEQYYYVQSTHLSSGIRRTVMSHEALMQGLYDFGSMKMNVDDRMEERSMPNWDNFIKPENLPKTPLPLGSTPMPFDTFLFD